MSVLLLQVWITPIPYQFQGKTFDESAYHGAHCSCHSKTGLHLHAFLDSSCCTISAEVQSQH